MASEEKEVLGNKRVGPKNNRVKRIWRYTYKTYTDGMHKRHMCITHTNKAHGVAYSIVKKGSYMPYAHNVHTTHLPYAHHIHTAVTP